MPTKRQTPTARQPTRENRGNAGLAFAPTTWLAFAPTTWRALVARLFAIDYRSLALFRMALALALAVDLFTQLPAFAAFHWGGGSDHRLALERYYEGVWNWSLFWWSDWPAYHVLLMAAAAVAGVCLLIGWHARLACLVAWLVITSLNDDAPPLTNGGDGLLGMLLFWSIFLPLGQRWGLDARRLPPPAGPTFTSVATAGVMLQMAMVYFFSGVSKWTPTWLDGTALELVLANPAITRPIGRLLSEASLVTRIFTWLTLTGELVLPFLLFSPWKTTLLRSISLLLLLAMHVGIELTINVLIFSIVSMAGLTSFVPSQWWQCFLLDRLARLFDRWQPAPVRRPPAGHHERAVRHRPLALVFARKAGAAALACVIAYCLAYNVIDNFGPPGAVLRIGGWQQFGVALKLTQRWNMFFDPRNQCFDVALIGEKSDRKFVDLLRPRAAVFDRTQAPLQPGQYPYERMLYFLLALPNRDFIPFRPAYMERTLRDWNASAAPNDQLVKLNLTYYPKKPHEMAGVRYVDMYEARP